MSRKKKIILISISIILVIALLVLVILLVNLKNEKKTEYTSSDVVYEQVSDKQISSFQDLKLIEELLDSGKILDENIGRDLDDDQKDILKNLGVSDNLIDTYKVYTSEELLNSNFISSENEGEQQVEDWKNNYKNEKYIISQSQELAFLANGRKDENEKIEYARLVNDDELYENVSEEVGQDNQTESTSIDIRQVERLKYNVNVDYPENVVEPKYAIKINDNETSDESLHSAQEILDTTSEISDNETTDQNQINSETILQTVQDDENKNNEVDYDSLEWIDYEGTIFIEENATIYTKYKLNNDDLEYTIGDFEEVPELILSSPTYEIVEDENSMYVKFSNIESDYNSEVKFKVSYGKKENEEEPVYCEWYEAQENKFNIEENGKYYIKFVANMPNKNVIDSNEMKISIGKLENEGANQIVDTTNEDIVKSNNTKLRSVRVNGLNLSESIINSLNTNGTAQYSLSSANSVTLKANAQDSNASIIGNGIYNFKNNKSTITIQVVAEDGSKRVYTLVVTRNSTSNISTSSNTTESSNSNRSEANTSNSSSENNNSNVNSSNNDNSNTGDNSQVANTNPSEGSTGGTSQGGSTNPSVESTGGASQGDSTNQSVGSTGGTTQGSNTNSNGSNSGASSSGGTTAFVCSHDWQAATCTTPKKCTKCGAMEGDKNASNHSNYGTTSKVTTEASCTTAQVTTIYCNGCGKEVSTTKGKTLEHSYTVKTTTSAYLKSSATCTMPATYYYACKCGAKGTTTYTSGNKNGNNHSNYGETSSSTVATCTKASQTVYRCKGCKAVTRTVTGKELGHVTTYTGYTKGRCNKISTVRIYCSRCNSVKTVLLEVHAGNPVSCAYCGKDWSKENLITIRWTDDI